MTQTIRTLEELRVLETQLLERAASTAGRLVTMTERGIEFLHRLKFAQSGIHPLTGAPLNLIEQLNQTFTCLASFQATRMLFEWHRENCSGFVLNLATARGSDIRSIEPGIVAAEVFAAVSPGNNRKLRADILKVQREEAQFRYVFFHCPRIPQGRQTSREPADGTVQVWSIAIANE